MGDLKNKDLIKIMWLPGENDILFSMKNEKSLSSNSKLYEQLNNCIDIGSWKKMYAEKYDNWLNTDDHSIYNIKDAVNAMMINALLKFNEMAGNEVIFYWFDVDRTYNENYIWEICPLSNKLLIPLDDKYPKINSLISPDYPLVFPSI